MSGISSSGGGGMMPARYPIDLIDVMRLPDGRRIAIRPVLPQDAGILRSFVSNLSPGSRRNRFLHPIPELSPAMLQRLIGVDHVQQVAILGEVFGASDEEMISEARYALEPDGVTAEFALATADDWQRQGIARTLLGMLQASAFAAGVRRLVGSTMRDNIPLVRLVQSFGFTIGPDRDDLRLLRLEKALHITSAR